jgi:hypothetical protein
MHLALHATNVCSNSVASTRLEMKIFRRQWDQFGESTSDLVSILDTEFKPSFGDDDHVIWIGVESAPRDAEQLAGFVVDFQEYRDVGISRVALSSASTASRWRPRF